MKKILVSFFSVFSLTIAAQNVGIGTLTPDASAQLDISSTTKGMLVPRMTMAQRDAIVSPATGLIIYQTDNTPGYYYFAGAIWVGISPRGDFMLPFSGNSSSANDLFVVSNNSSVNPFNVIKGINNRNGGIALYGENNAPNGTGAYFNSVNGPALVTGLGNVGFGFTWAGNTDLGINKAKLMVRGSVGGSMAIFGDNTTGISLETNSTIGFNSYINSLRTLTSNGFAGAMDFTASTGRFSWSISSASGTAGSTVTELERMTILANGNMGIGTPAPTRKLHVAGGLRVDTLAGGAGGVLQTNASGEVSKLSFTGSNTDVLRGDGTFGSLPGAGSNYWTLSGSNIYKNNAGNVGVGTITPLYPLSVSSNGAGLVQESIGALARIGFYTSGTFAALQTQTNSDLHFATNGSVVPDMTLTTAGRLGIGTSSPGYLLDVNGRMRVRHITGQTSGLWLNKADNTEGAFIGMVNDSTAGFWGNGTTGNWQVSVDIKNAMMGIGTTDPTAPLSFSTSLGNKIALWGNATANHYGLGIQGSQLQLYTDASTSDILLGYGRSSAFTENAKFLGNGNIHIGKYTTWSSATDSRKINFGDGDFLYLGETEADDRLTLRAGSFDFKNGNVFIGATDFSKGSGYRLRVNGKVIAEEMRVQLVANWPDYVFGKNHKLKSINEVEQFIQANGHLPGIQPAAEIEKNGFEVGDMNKRLLEKVEELTLYIIELKKEIDILKANR